MNTALLTIKTDPQTKKQVQEFAAGLGLTTTGLVNAVLKQVLREKRVVLTTDELVPTPYLEKIMREVNEDLKHGRNIKHTSGTDEAMAHLNGLMKK